MAMPLARSMSQILSAIWSASSRSWVDMKTVFWSVCVRLWSSCMTSTLLGKSRKAVGSSRKMMGVSCASALAIITFCRSPSLRVCTMRWVSGSMRTRAMASCTILRSLSLSVPQKPV